ncbi:uncharacterized protein [Argopecten irradians]|uniref:uncharacterized protein n=1 Tax=Argopecten irradians TaxID=31199 RepID=UPI003710C5A8
MEVLSTITTEVEAILNDRPLTYISSDVNDPDPLCPSHFLYGRKLKGLQYPDESSSNEDEITEDVSHDQLLKRFSRKQKLIEHFWHRWKQEYVTSLREFHKKSRHATQTIKEGDVVQIRDNSTRGKWKLAIVKELIRGKDGFVRAATVDTASGRTNRPIVKLYPLEVNIKDVTDCTPRIQRRAKLAAEGKIKTWTLSK